jgi:integrase
MLFRVYSRFVPNLTRNDGLAFAGLVNGHFGTATVQTSSPPATAGPDILSTLQSLTPEQLATLLTLAKKAS